MEFFRSLLEQIPTYPDHPDGADLVQNQGNRCEGVACATIKPVAADNGANPPVRPGFHETAIRLRSAPWPTPRPDDATSSGRGQPLRRQRATK
jgi:hypothetical protein